MIKQLATLWSPGGARARLSTLIFHRVHAVKDEMFPSEMDASQFDRVCSWLKSWFNVLPLEEAVTRLNRGDLPERAACITFDDGYADNEAVAAPILRRHGLPCTFFIATGYLDGGCMWNDRIIESLRRTRLPSIDLRGLGLHVDSLALGDLDQRRLSVDRLIPRIKYLPQAVRLSTVEALEQRAEVTRPTQLMMSSSAVKALHTTGFSIGAHTITHPILLGSSVAETKREIEGGRERLESLLGVRVSLFAYPNGKPGVDYGTRALKVVREAGFDAAVSTQWGVATQGSDHHQVPRFTPWDIHRTKFGLRMLQNLRRALPTQPLPSFDDSREALARAR